MCDGNDQRVHHTHQALDMIHEEIIRLELSSLDKNRLKRNAETGRSERDSEVYTQSARWVGFFGEEFVNKTMWDSSSRKYDKYYKQVLLIRRLLRKSGFLSDHNNARLPFFSTDLKTEMHHQLHNFKHFGEKNFDDAMAHLRAGKGFCSLLCSPQPKTAEEEDKILKRSVQSKEEIHSQLILSVKQALSVKDCDQYLLSALRELTSKKAQSFNPKQVLLDLSGEIHQYIKNLHINGEIDDLLMDIDEDEDDEV